MQHPAKRRKAEAVAEPVATTGSGDENGSKDEAPPASPAKSSAARWNAELLAHNAAVKADASAMQGRRAVFLDEHLEVRQQNNGAGFRRVGWGGVELGGVGAGLRFRMRRHCTLQGVGAGVAQHDLPALPRPALYMSSASQVLRPFITAEVTASLHAKAAAARAAGLPPLPEPVERQPGGRRMGPLLLLMHPQATLRCAEGAFHASCALIITG